MSKEIKITMLGATGSGKTCYMLGMYAHMQLGVNGLTLSTTNLDDDLRLVDAWERLVDVRNEKRWPPPNVAETSRSYRFNFNYGFTPLISFEWLDYRGGAIRSLSDESDVPNLLKHLTGSSCVFLCISGEYLAEPLTQASLMRVSAESGVRRMTSLMTKVAETVKPTRQQPFPIAIVITKYDMCSHRKRDEMVADVKKLFSSLFAPNAPWLTMICPVSLGVDLAKNKDEGEIAPVNVDLPIAFAIYTRMREDSLRQQQAQASRQSELDRLQRAGFLERLFIGDDLRRNLEAMQAIQSQIGTIEANMKLLIRRLTERKLEFYLGDQHVELGL